MNPQHTIQELLERARVHIGGPESGDIMIHDERFYTRVLAEGSLGLGESYMDGWWDAKQLDEFFFLVDSAELDKAVHDKHLLLNTFKARLFNMQDKARS
ncbi:MAG: cyclopropane-fatty-acyl-phospholipid synthase, partial [Pseudohongiella sp.]|nr:cyclopropane-fatty-acyl-phospholipid synthase [Pseudohongiella sp.]